MHKSYFPFANDQKCFEFTHPVEQSSFNQYKNIQFKFQEDLTIHGFAGYFKSVLYDQVTISTSPTDHTEGLMSWFPMYFPVMVCKTLILVPCRNKKR